MFPQYTRNQCTHLGLTLETCQGLTKSECYQCNKYDPRCRLKAVDTLFCNYDIVRVATNLTEDECTSYGYCTSNTYSSCYFNVSYIDAYECPVCLWNSSSVATNERYYQLESSYRRKQEQLTRRSHITTSPKAKINSGGDVFSSTLGQWSGINGCEVYYSNTEANCVAGGGVWKESISTRRSCLSVMACHENDSKYCKYKYDGSPGSEDFVTNKTMAECIKCGGVYKNAYTWRTPKYKIVPLFTTRWTNVTWEPINKFIPVMSKELFTDQIERFIYIQPGTFITTSILCDMSPTLSTLTQVTCNCIEGYSNLDFCKNQQEISYSLGKQIFCYADPQTVRFGPIQLSIAGRSVPLSSYCLTFTIDLYGASQFQVKQIIGTSGLLSTLLNNNNPYAIVKNKYGIVVGQLLTDGLGLGISSSIFTVSPNYTLNSNNTVKVCIDARNDINQDRNFVILDFAVTSDFVKFTPSESVITYDGTSYCGYVYVTDGIVFPIALFKDWQVRDSIFYGNRGVQHVMYFLSAFMFAIFLVSLGFVIYNVWETKLKIRITKICLFLIMVYSAVRAVFFLLFSIEKLTNLPSDNPSAYFVVAELPYYIFLSIFIFVVLFWVQVVYSNIISVDKMLVLAFILHLILYSLFVIICILASKINNAQVANLNIAYKIIIASIAFLIVIAAWVFGLYFIATVIKGAKMRKNTS
eukprot:TRINITY_DN2419_c0_g1_i5.p1 TRINITY_DN2419_c0_g1~~TRINITY_DN2419_c0_g1_i5.p1  ORF type:complete len:695 (+),score=110.25 TRINITY_DN2419_c0_g1_i5:1878-3962(+)